MAYTPINTDELMIIVYYNNLVVKIATFFNCSRILIYSVIAFLKESHAALDYCRNIKKIKNNVGEKN